jgi:phenylpyruvate tautomerase PptA (4-oxalocrotonate tautomerase family)
MPIIDIEIVLQPNEKLRSKLAGELADRAAEILVSPKGGTWVKIHPIKNEHYAENGAGPDEGIYPVFVSILKAQPPESHAMRTEALSLAAAIALACARPPENVHIFYEPAAAGRALLGGTMVE